MNQIKAKLANLRLLCSNLMIGGTCVHDKYHNRMGKYSPKYVDRKSKRWPLHDHSTGPVTGPGNTIGTKLENRDKHWAERLGKETR
jgi:hypothetical protein